MRLTEIGSNAHSIWLLHARWIAAGHSYFDRAIGDPVMAFSHSDYPYYVPGPDRRRCGWRLTGSAAGARPAQLLVSVLTGALSRRRAS